MTIEAIKHKFERAFETTVFTSSDKFECEIKEIIGEIISYLKEKESTEKSESFKKEAYGRSDAKWARYNREHTIELDGKVSYNPVCEWCAKGDKPEMLDEDGVKCSISGQSGVLSHAFGDAFWKCAA